MWEQFDLDTTATQYRVQRIPNGRTGYIGENLAVVLLHVYTNKKVLLTLCALRM